MGIKINGKVVSYDPFSNHLINSNPHDNPVLQELDGMEVLSLFRRVKSNRVGPGDGNPLIYALKGLDGYTIDKEGVTSFLPDFYAVLAKAASALHADYVLPIPSSSNISQMFARRVARSLSISASPFQLRKKTHRAICNDLDLLFRAGVVPKQDLRSLQVLRQNLARSLSTTFAMKLIEHRLRKYFAPFSIARSAEVPARGTALVVDDLLSSGTSLRSAKDLLKSHEVQNVKFLCLLSSTGPISRLR